MFMDPDGFGPFLAESGSGQTNTALTYLQNIFEKFTQNYVTTSFVK